MDEAVALVAKPKKKTYQIKTIDDSITVTIPAGAEPVKVTAVGGAGGVAGTVSFNFLADGSIVPPPLAPLQGYPWIFTPAGIPAALEPPTSHPMINWTVNIEKAGPASGKPVEQVPPGFGIFCPNCGQDHHIETSSRKYSTHYCRYCAGWFTSQQLVQSTNLKIEDKTQKVRGLRVLSTFGYHTPDYSAYSASAVLDNPETIKKMVNKFIRPCPVKPRHGFVESRSVKSEEEATKVIKEALAADESAEIIIMPYIKAPYSGIWTEGLLSIGPGTDGATSGKNSFSVPILGSLIDVYNKKPMFKSAGITDSPYVEMLWTPRQQTNVGRVAESQECWHTTYVQLRNGPKLPKTIDYIPEDVKVKKVVLAEGDLLEWEERIRKLPKGAVVYHPGGSLASHYSVHAVLNNIPVIISFKPEVGQVLEPTANKSPAPDLAKLRAGFVAGCRAEAGYATITHFMLVGCHSTTLWLGKYDLLLGFAIGCAYRLLVTATLGEGRYYLYYKAAKHNGANGACSIVPPDRDKVYKDAWNLTLTEPTRVRFVKAVDRFGNTSVWGEYGGVGGIKWQRLGTWAGLIYNALVDGDTTKILETFNKGVNAVHNNGWAFNKFLSASHMNTAATNPLKSALACAPLLYQAAKTDSKLVDWFEGKRKLVEAPVQFPERSGPHTTFHFKDNQEPMFDGTACKCKEHECKFCFPLGFICTCKQHICIDCFPDGCPCKQKICHDCKNPACDLCNAGKVKCSGYNQIGGYKCTKPLDHAGNHSMYYKGKLYKTWASTSPPKSPEPPKIEPKPVKKKVGSKEIQNASSSHPGAHARLWDEPGYIHVQYVVPGEPSGHYNSTNIKLSDKDAQTVAKIFLTYEVYDLEKSWGSPHKGYLPLTKSATDSKWLLVSKDKNTILPIEF